MAKTPMQNRHIDENTGYAFWHREEPIYDERKYFLQGHTDYSLWHKDANLAETNTIIVEAKAVGKMD
ncbi:hypothetical protein RIB2604_02101150 [Aspergillus luchuensis]|uniref:Uncharacterized protein n=1 Tax=Aspergillus kawachii TaxID=1069201 RepID=A0A146FM12_ASPKA|nr:hypothetical protein RIB2604_02101150 [Aspergillus luchuensis]